VRVLLDCVRPDRDCGQLRNVGSTVTIDPYSPPAGRKAELLRWHYPHEDAQKLRHSPSKPVSLTGKKHRWGMSHPTSHARPHEPNHRERARQRFSKHPAMIFTRVARLETSTRPSGLCAKQEMRPLLADEVCPCLVYGEAVLGVGRRAASCL